jgi:hypothetical protein
MPRFEAYPLSSGALPASIRSDLEDASLASLREAKAPRSSRLGFSAQEKIVQFT